MTGDRVYYLHTAEGQVGPLTAGEILAREAAGEISGASFLWRDGFEEWMTLDAVRAELAPAPPVPQPSAPSMPSAPPRPTGSAASTALDGNTSKTLRTPSRRWLGIALALFLLLALGLFFSCRDETPVDRDDSGRVTVARDDEAAAPAEEPKPVAFEAGRITFLGAASQVSGSCHLVEFEDVRFIIDAGAFLEEPRTGRSLMEGQGDRYYADLPIPPAAIDFLLLTHAHTDHMGRIPWLFARGARPKILLTTATRDLLRKTIPDLLRTTDLPGDELFFERGSRTIHSRRRDCPNLRGVPEARVEPWNSGRRKAFEERRDLCSWCLDAEWREIEALMIPVTFGAETALTDRLRVTMHAASHMLGAAWLRIEYDLTPETTLVLAASGDMGDDRNLLFPRTLVEMESDYAIVESTYGFAGEEVIPDEGSWASFRPFVENIAAALAAKKLVMIPAFVEDRSHKVIAALQWGMKEGLIPASIPIYLTSNTAADLVDIYAEHARPNAGYHTGAFLDLYRAGGLSPYRPTNLKLGREREYPRPSIVIAHSAMMDYGESKRILEEMVDDPNLHIVIVGYQAPQSPGGWIKNMGESTIVLAGRERAIKASRASFGHLFSSHARGAELVRWLDHVKPSDGVFIVHGERRNAEALRKNLDARPAFAGKCVIPKYLERFPLLTTRITRGVEYEEPRTVVPLGSPPTPAPASASPVAPSPVAAGRPTPVAGRLGITSIREDAVTISGSLTILGVIKELSGNVRWPASVIFKDAALRAALAAQVTTARSNSGSAAPLQVTRVEVTPVNRGSVIAEAAIEFNNVLRLEGLRLMKKRDGGDFVAPPSAKRGAAWVNHARFTNELEEQIRRAMKEELARTRR